MRWAFWRRRDDRLDCDAVRRLMQSFLDDELPRQDADLVVAHLRDCDRCGVDADTYRRVKERLVHLRIPADPDSVSHLERFVAELTAETPEV